MYHAHCIQRDVHSRHDNLTVNGVQHLWQHITEETVVCSLLFMETKYQFAIVVLLHLVYDTMRKVSRQTHFCKQRYIHRCSYIRSYIKNLFTACIMSLVLIDNNRYCRQWNLTVLFSHQQSKIHQFVNHIGIGKCKQCLLRVVGNRCYKLIGRQHQIP